MEEGRTRPSIRELLEFDDTIRAICVSWHLLNMEEGVLFRLQGTSEDSNTQLVVPRAYKHQLFLDIHAGRLGGHLGITRMVEMLRQRFYWPMMAEDVARWCKECTECAQVKPGPRFRAALHQVAVACPMDRVAMDIVGQLPETEAGNKYILVISDYYTKWVQAHAIPDQTAQTVADVYINHWVAL